MAYEQTAESFYKAHQGDRSQFIKRAEYNAMLTVPSLFPEGGDRNNNSYQTPHQSVGSRGVNTMSSALSMALLPASGPFFRLPVRDVLKELVATELEVDPSDIDRVMADYELDIHSTIISSGFRVTTAQVIDQLLVAGNAMTHIPDSGRSRMFRLDRYVIVRDPMGQPLRSVICEDISLELIRRDPKLREHMVNAGKPIEAFTPMETSIPLYTNIEWVGGKQVVHQELEGKVIEDTKKSYDADAPAYLPLRFDAQDGEHYGRAYVDRFYGDLKTVDGLARSLDEFAAAASKILFIVKPNSVASLDDLANKRSGDFITANPDDVGTLQMEKYPDFRVVKEQHDSLIQRLNYAFLITDGMVRQAERVTAEEVRMISQNAQRALSSAYSLLSEEYQKPVLMRYIHRMGDELEGLPLEYVEPSIIAGHDALGREDELERMDRLVMGTGADLSFVSTYIDFGEYFSRRANLLFVGQQALVKTKQQREAEQQQALEAKQSEGLPTALVAAGAKVAGSMPVSPEQPQ